MDQFNQIGHDYVSRNFNDRRPGASFNKDQYPKGGNHRPDAGGSSVTAKPKKPKPSPHSPRPAEIKQSIIYHPQRIR